MNDDRILGQIAVLVEHERRLRGPGADGRIDARHDLQAVEVELDQCWDLLRRRGVRRALGGEPDRAALVPASVAGTYWL